MPAATKGRKHGLRMVGSLQDWSQLIASYGKEDAETVLSCFRNYVILAAANAETAIKASAILGEQEVRRARVSFTAGRQTRAQEIKKEYVVMASEISNLNDLEAYLKFGEDFPITKIKLPYVDHKERAPSIVIAGQA